MVLDLVYWPDSILRNESHEVKPEDIPLLSPFVDDLIATMYDKNGQGLSAIQVGNDVRLFVLDVGLGPEVYFNPIITDFVGDPAIMDGEGCLSVPGFYAPVQRHLIVRGHAFDRDGKKFDFENDTTGNASQCLARYHTIQHETEHLNGEIFLDHLNQMQRERARQLMKKFRGK
jgi:peptide deformylase